MRASSTRVPSKEEQGSKDEGADDAKESDGEEEEEEAEDTATSSNSDSKEKEPV